MARGTIQQIVDRTQRRLDTVVKEFSQDLAEEVVRRTPVDTGFLRASWFVSLDNPGGTATERSAGGGVQGLRGTLGRMNLKISAAKAGDVIYIVNGAEYAGYVEKGTSRMRGRFFVRSVIRDANTIAERTIIRIRRQ